MFGGVGLEQQAQIIMPAQPANVHPGGGAVADKMGLGDKALRLLRSDPQFKSHRQLGYYEDNITTQDPNAPPGRLRGCRKADHR